MNNEIERFAKTVATDPAFRDKVKAIGTDTDALVGFANKAGYKFSNKDVAALTRTDELSDTDLEKVAGGMKSVLLAGSSSGYVYATKGRVFVWF